MMLKETARIIEAIDSAAGIMTQWVNKYIKNIDKIRLYENTIAYGYDVVLSGDNTEATISIGAIYKIKDNLVKIDLALLLKGKGGVTDSATIYLHEVEDIWVYFTVPNSILIEFIDENLSAKFGRKNIREAFCNAGDTPLKTVHIINRYLKEFYKRAVERFYGIE